MACRSLLPAFVVTLVVAGMIVPAWGSANLNAYLAPGITESHFDVTYKRATTITHYECSAITDILREAGGTVEVAALDGDPDAEILKAALNENIMASGSGASIRNLDVYYEAVLTRDRHNITIDYEVKINGTLGGDVVSMATHGRPAVVDVSWRNLTVTEPVTIRGTEINLPHNSFEALMPDMFAALPEEAVSLLEIPLITTAPIQDAPLETWHFLFDPTGGFAHRDPYGVSEQVPDEGRTTYTLGDGYPHEFKGRIIEHIVLGADSCAFVMDEDSHLAYIHAVGFSEPSVGFFISPPYA